MHELLVVSKQTKRDNIPPETVANDPEGGLAELYRGFVEVRRKVPPLFERGAWGKNRCGWREGRYSYTIIGIFGEEVVNFPEVILDRALGLFPEDELGRVNLPGLTSLGDYSSISIPRATIPRLLPHIAISGGLADGVEPLHSLYIGDYARPYILRPAHKPIV